MNLFNILTIASAELDIELGLLILAIVILIITIIVLTIIKKAKK